jgi:ubiquinone/menaquinone biosynthesis C-methylase UbiE
MDLTVRGEIGAYYATGDEGDRLAIGYFQLERLRTEAILARHLPDRPAKLFDIGGGTGPYARTLTARGYEVHLLDPIPAHVEAACRPDANGVTPASAEIGDARELPWGDGEADAALLLGPLYHLPDLADRCKAISEAYRVLRPGGVVVAAGISRLSVPLDGIKGPPTGKPKERLPLKEGLRLVERAVRTGQYANPTDDRNMFTTAYMHRPAELVGEISAGGFAECRYHAVEGPGAWLPGFQRAWRRRNVRAALCEIARASGGVPLLRALTPHMVVTAHKPT